MITGGEVEFHVQSLPQRAEEMGHKLRALVGGDVRGNSVLGEDMEYEKLGQLRGCDCVEGRYEYPLLGESVNDD